MTSGLESPLSNLLVFAILAIGMHRITVQRYGGITIFLSLFGLLYLNRADLVLLIGPFVVVIARLTFRDWRALARSAAIAAVPVISWTAFSLIYYGYLLPNTAFGKLALGISETDRLHQGLLYLVDALGHDVLTVPVIVVGAVLGFRRGPVGIALAAGILLYIGYIVAIGGDQMSGRFLVSPLAVAAAILARERLRSGPALARMGLLMALGLLNLPGTLLSDVDIGPAAIRKTGIADERAVFYHVYGLERVTRDAFNTWPWPKQVRIPSRVQIIGCGGLGTIGLADGPAVHLADQCALADPLMSHLPAKSDPQWRISHIERELPDGYAASIIANDDRITDPKIADLYRVVRTITRGPLFTRARWRDIVHMNFGIAPASQGG